MPRQLLPEGISELLSAGDLWGKNPNISCSSFYMVNLPHVLICPYIMRLVLYTRPPRTEAILAFFPFVSLSVQPCLSVCLSVCLSMGKLSHRKKVSPSQSQRGSAVRKGLLSYKAFFRCWRCFFRKKLWARKSFWGRRRLSLTRASFPLLEADESVRMERTRSSA